MKHHILELESFQMSSSHFKWAGVILILLSLINFILQEIKADLRRREEELKASTESGALITGDSTQNAPGQLLPDPRAQGIVGSTLANVLVIVGFAAFAYTVKYVLKSIAQSDD